MKELLSRYNSREKTILTIAVIILSGILIHALLIEPFNQKKIELNEALEQADIDLKWMRSAVYQLPRGTDLAQAINFEGSLANLIDKEVRSQNLSNFLTQMTPINDDEIRIRYNDINFNQLLKFIAQVSSRGLEVKDLRINATDKTAEVDCSLVLEKVG